MSHDSLGFILFFGIADYVLFGRSRLVRGRQSAYVHSHEERQQAASLSWVHEIQSKFGGVPSWYLSAVLFSSSM